MLPVAQEQHVPPAGPGRPSPTQTSGGSSVSTNLGMGLGQHLTTGRAVLAVRLNMMQGPKTSRGSSISNLLRTGCEQPLTTLLCGL